MFMYYRLDFYTEAGGELNLGNTGRSSVAEFCTENSTSVVEYHSSLVATHQLAHK